jgi:hypothetical protein
MEPMWKQGPLAQQSLESGSKFDLADGERVTEVEGSVHVREGEASEPLGVFFANLCGCQPFQLFLRRGIDVKQLFLFPSCLILFLQSYQMVALSCL